MQEHLLLLLQHVVQLADADVIILQPVVQQFLQPDGQHCGAFIKQMQLPQLPLEQHVPCYSDIGALPALWPPSCVY